MADVFTAVPVAGGEREVLSDVARFVEPGDAQALVHADAWLERAPEAPLDADLAWWRDSTYQTGIGAVLETGQVDQSDLVIASSGWNEVARRALLSSANDTVYRLVPEMDLLRLARQDYPAADARLAHQASTRLSDSNFFLLSRDFAKFTLADYFADSLKSKKSMAWNDRLRLLQQCLRLIVDLHEDKIVHGGLRPGNIAVLPGFDVAFLDWGLRTPLQTLSPRQRIYIAPEARSGAPLAASDVYGWVKICQLLLRDELNGTAHHLGKEQARVFDWILDFASSASSAERPTARELLDFLFPAATSPMPITYATDVLGGETQSQIEKFPETSLALRSASSERRIERIIDRPAKVAHDREVLEKSDPTHLFQLTSPLPTIDARWRQRLVDNHSRPRGAVEDQLSAEDRILRATELANMARLELLNRDTYLYSAGVAQLLSAEQADGPVTSDIVTLRQWGYLLAVPDHGRWLYPRFQFDTASAGVFPVVFDVNQALSDEEPWSVLAWWLSPRPRALRGKSFKDVVADPAPVYRELARLRPPSAFAS